MSSPTTIEPVTPSDPPTWPSAGPSAARRGTGYGMLTAVPGAADELPDSDPAEVLELVVRALRTQLDAPRCAILLRRADGLLEQVACDTAPGGERRGRRVAPERAMLAHEAIRTRRTAVTADGATRCRPHPTRSALVIPLVVDGDVVGVLEIERSRPASDGGADGDSDRTRGFAELAEAALERGMRTTRAAHRDRMLAEAEQARCMQARLTRAVLDGAELDDVVTLLAGLLRRPVAVLDPALRVRAWAAPPALRLSEPPSLSAAALDVPAVREALAGLGPDTPSTVLAPHLPSGLTRRHVIAVLRTEGKVAGYLDVIEMGRSLERAETVVAEHAATVLSLQLLAETRQVRAGAQARDDVLADLLRSSRAPEDLRRSALHVGLDLQRPHLLVRLPVAPDRSPAACRAPAVAALTGVLDDPPLALPGPGAVVLLVPLPDDPGPPVLRRLHRGLGEVLDVVGTHTGIRRAVVSGVCRDVADFPAAHAETTEVDEIVAALGGRGGVVPVAELGTLRLVVNGGRAEVAVRFADQALGPLRRSDDTTGGDLVDTLRRYLGCGAQVRATAKALGVHENTVRYRLGRIEHITGLDMRRFDALLTAQLAFQVEGLGVGHEEAGHE
jgi:hypothetical protein